MQGSGVTRPEVIAATLRCASVPNVRPPCDGSHAPVDRG